MTSKFLEILSDETNSNFKATTCALAKLKFNRLLKKYPAYSEYGDVLIKSAADIETEGEYDKYLQWLSNPRGVKGHCNPDPGYNDLLPLSDYLTIAGIYHTLPRFRCQPQILLKRRHIRCKQGIFLTDG